MVKTQQIRHCQGLNKLGSHVVAMHNPDLFNKLFQEMIVLFQNEIRLCKKSINYLLVLSQLSIG